MNKIIYNINTDEISDLRTNTYSINDINFKNTINYDENDINEIKSNYIKDKENKENNDYNTTSNNIESEIENDIKKLSLKIKINKNQNKKIDLIDNYLIQLKQ